MYFSYYEVKTGLQLENNFYPKFAAGITNIVVFYDYYSSFGL